MQLTDKVAIVTGGARGIGRSIAYTFAKNGAKVIIISRTKEEIDKTVKELTRDKLNVVGFLCDVSKVSDVEQLVNLIMGRYSFIDILVNNAGVQQPIGFFKDVDMMEWIKNIEINLFGVVNFSRCVLSAMIERRKGKIINLSGGGSTSPRPNFSAYSVSKTAVVRFTETLAEEVRKFNVQVNAISPGAVNTRMLDEVINSGDKVGDKEINEAKERAIQGGVSPDIAASLALFLASSKSDEITGKLISAPWDPWEEEQFIDKLKTDKEIATLRRIDEKHFFKKA